jgi:hypothetical protein
MIDPIVMYAGIAGVVCIFLFGICETLLSQGGYGSKK